MNINPLAKRILCFGDSNTWGYIPGSGHERYNSNVRWTGVLQELLGNDYEIIEEGLNSRGIMKGDDRVGKEGRSSIQYIDPCLDTHDPLDFVIVFLGTNELKAEYNLSSSQVGENLKTLILKISFKPSQFRKTKPEIIIIVPPVINENTEYCLKGNKYIGASKKSVELKDVYKKVAEETGSKLLDIQEKLEIGEDGIHLLEKSHKILGIALSGLLKL